MAPLDRVAREREYSPSSLIGGDYAAFLERYRAESAAALRTLAVQRDLRYGDASRALIDYFPPPVPAHRPGLLIYFHGGYWQELSKEESAFLAPAWHVAGFAHAVVGYSLAPGARLPDIVDECRAAVEWLHARADRLGFDGGNIVAAGSSAGAYLAAACADAVPAGLRGIVPVSGIYDVAALLGTSINEALALDVATAAAMDLLTTSRRFCPAVIAWGEIETAEFKRQSRAFAARLASDAIPCTALEVPGRNHFDVVLELADPASPLFAAARALFASAGVR
jgi:arylformamidase